MLRSSKAYFHFYIHQASNGTNKYGDRIETLAFFSDWFSILLYDRIFILFFCFLVVFSSRRGAVAAEANGGRKHRSSLVDGAWIYTHRWAHSHDCCDSAAQLHFVVYELLSDSHHFPTAARVLIPSPPPQTPARFLSLSNWIRIKSIFKIRKWLDLRRFISAGGLRNYECPIFDPNEQNSFICFFFNFCYNL